MKDDIKVNKANKSITFINNGIAFSQFGVADEILDLITNLQEEIERLKKPDYYEKGLVGSIKERDEIIQDYKSRCEKAIECINYYAVENEDYSKIYNDEEKELLNILNGGDDNGNKF